MKPLSLMTVVIMAGDLTREPRSVKAADRRLSIHIATRPDDELVRTSMSKARQRVAARDMVKGDVCFFALDVERVAGWVWLSRAHTYDRVTGLHYRLAPWECIGYDAVALPEYRRRAGVGTRLLEAVLQYGHEDAELKRIYGAADVRGPSPGLMRNFEFEKVQTVKLLQVFERRGIQMPFSDRPRYGPASRQGAHSESGLSTFLHQGP